MASRTSGGLGLPIWSTVDGTPDALCGDDHIKRVPYCQSQERLSEMLANPHSADLGPPCLAVVGGSCPAVVAVGWSRLSAVGSRLATSIFPASTSPFARALHPPAGTSA